MSQPNKQSARELHIPAVPASDVDSLLSAFCALDRIVVEISMHIYDVPPSDRAAMLKQHRRLHDALRERLPRFLYPPRQRDQIVYKDTNH